MLDLRFRTTILVFPHAYRNIFLLFGQTGRGGESQQSHEEPGSVRGLCANSAASANRRPGLEWVHSQTVACEQARRLQTILA